jgi:hypothetical protein
MITRTLGERDEGIIFDLGFASSWKKELKSMDNRQNVGIKTV